MTKFPSNINDYDDLIKQAWDKYLAHTGLSYNLLKAQLFQESSFHITVKSPVGAEGIAQFMPATWKQIAKEMKFPSDASPNQPEYAIPAAAYYMNKLWNQWSSPRPTLDRYYLALSSYNAGLGNILKAQKKSGGRTRYQDIINYLPQVTGSRNASETIGYVKHIRKYYTEFQIDSITKK